MDIIEPKKSDLSRNAAGVAFSMHVTYLSLNKW